MAKRQSSTKSATKSDVIREILRAKPNANVKEIKATMQEQGVKASDALINKLKYGRKATGSRKKPRGRASNSQPSKADAIRGMLGKLGFKSRPRDVISALADQGIVVSSAQVSTLRKSTKRRGAVAVTTTSTSVSLEHLMAAKNLAERLGGIDVARQALASLAKIMGS